MTHYIILRDTRGSFSLAIRLPTKDSKPRKLGKKKPPNRKQYMKNWYKKNRKRLLEKYRKNRKHILEQKREYHSRPEVKLRVAAYNKNRVRVIADKKRK